MEPSHPPPESIYLLLLAFLLLCSMFFSASETAFLSSSRLHIRYLMEKGNKAASRVEKLLRKKTLFLNSILIGNNIVNITTSSLVTAMAISAFGDAGIGIATAAATIIILVFGEILPKSIALIQPERIATKASLPLSIFIVIASPLIFTFTVITGILTMFSGKRKRTDTESVTEEDIKTLIEVGEEEGILETRERDMMHKILKYTNLNTRDIMTPRTDIVSIEINATRAEILEVSRNSRFSRFPVCGEDIDDIRGILYIKDILITPNTDDGAFTAKDLLRPALFIFENQKISMVQKKLREENQNIAIVIDEYGGVAGLVTAEDLAEEIFGGLHDEYDKPEATTQGDSLTVEGSMRLDEINERLSIRLTSEFYDTIGGFIMERYGDIPIPGTSIADQGYSFTVTAVAGNRVETVKIFRPGEGA